MMQVQRKTMHRGLGLLMFAVGGVLGMVFLGSMERVPKSVDGPVTSSSLPSLSGPFAANAKGQRPVSGDLVNLHMWIAEKHAHKLQAVRDQAMRDQWIQAGGLVPARLLAGGKEVQGRVRIKGDMVDHVDTDKWSFRVELKGDALLGMSRFSIQHPKTRGFWLEWLFMQAARREGLLVPRSQFVQVVINDRPCGVYYLEEHFTKEMLESQGRRDGPVVRFDESLIWQGLLQYVSDPTHGLPFAVTGMGSVQRANIDAFGEQHLGRADALNDRLHRGLFLLRKLQQVLIEKQPQDRFWQEQLNPQPSAAELGGVVDAVCDASKLGRMLALYCLFHAEHGLDWRQWRFYHDPVLDRLEPVIFDVEPAPGFGVQSIATANLMVEEYMHSDYFREAVFVALARMVQPDYLKSLLDSLDDEFQVIAQALLAEGSVPEDHHMSAVRTALEQRSKLLRGIFQVPGTVRLSGRVLPGFGVEVAAWTQTDLPVILEEFRSEAGASLSAARGLAQDQQQYRRAGNAVFLPKKGQHLLLRLPLTANKLTVRYRIVGAKTSQTESLRVHEILLPPADNDLADDLMTTLEQHACLGYVLEQDRLFLRRGDFAVQGDLRIPAGRILHAEGGTTLRFAPGARLITSAALRWQGGKAGKIVLMAQDKHMGWAGLQVTDAASDSRLRHVHFRGMRPAKGTVAIQFFRSNANLVQCRIQQVAGQALMVQGAFMSLRFCEFSDLEGCAVLAGHAGQLSILECQMHRVGIAVLAMQQSKIDMQDLSVVDPGRYALVALGASQILARGLVSTNQYLVQAPSLVTVNDQKVPGQVLGLQELQGLGVLDR